MCALRISSNNFRIIFEKLSKKRRHFISRHGCPCSSSSRSTRVKHPPRRSSPPPPRVLRPALSPVSAAASRSSLLTHSQDSVFRLKKIPDQGGGCSGNPLAVVVPGSGVHGARQALKGSKWLVNGSRRSAKGNQDSDRSPEPSRAQRPNISNLTAGTSGTTGGACESECECTEGFI